MISRHGKAAAARGSFSVPLLQLGGGGGKLSRSDPPAHGNDDDDDDDDNDDGQFGRGEQGTSDLIRLDELSEETIAKSLAGRFWHDQIYTFMGEVLTSVNPYRSIGKLYSDEQAARYQHTAPERCDAGVLELNEPHLFAVAELAYRRLQASGRSQSIVISGESGAGKTEATKLLLGYLARRARWAAAGHGGQQLLGVEAKIMDANPVLEAFGNARTVRNHNSSRFGKLVELHLDATGTAICRARVARYLLEKSRVVQHSAGERNYHVFYYLCAGLAPDVRHQLALTGGARSFHYLNQGATNTDADAAADAAHFERLRQALASVGVSQARQHAVWQLLAAVLHLGQLRFAAAAVKTPRDASGRAQSGASNHKYQDACELAADSQPSLAAAAALLGVDAAALLEYLSSREVLLPGTAPFRAPLPPADAESVRDGTAKALYDGLFAWLLDAVNASLSNYSSPPPLSSSSSSSSSSSVQSPLPVIGVLDIFGFESFDDNSFEQLCINWANERLNDQFIKRVVTLEAHEYVAQGLPVSSATAALAAGACSSSSGCLDLLEGKLGVLSLLDEQCRFPSATPQSFLDKIFHGRTAAAATAASRSASAPQLSTPAAASLLERVRTNPLQFVIHHFAGPVVYSAQHLLDKNRDSLPAGFAPLLQSSTSPLLPAIVGHATAGPQSGRRATLGSCFRAQLTELAQLLDQSEPLFVRCIKPNGDQRPQLIERELFLRQLRYSGLLSACRVRKDGYPVRFTFDQFLARFAALSGCQSSAAVAQRCAAIATAVLQSPRGSTWELGHTKIYLRTAASQQLEARRLAVLSALVVRLQARCRAALVRRRCRQVRRAAVVIQRAYRRYAERERAALRLRAVVLLQAHARRVLAQRAYRRLRDEQRQRDEEQRRREREEEECRQREQQQREKEQREQQQREQQQRKEQQREQQQREEQHEEQQRIEKERQQTSTDVVPVLAMPVEVEAVGKSALPVLSRDEGSLTIRLARRLERHEHDKASSGGAGPLLPERRRIAPPSSVWADFYSLPASTLDFGVQRAEPSSKPAEKAAHPLLQLFEPPTAARAADEVDNSSGSGRQQLGTARTIDDHGYLELTVAAHELVSSESAKQYPWHDYVRQNFNKQRPSRFSLRRRPCYSVEQLASYSPTPLPLPLLRQTSSAAEAASNGKIAQTALALYADVHSWIAASGKEPVPSKKALGKLVRTVFSTLQSVPCLRDEYYAVLIKLSTTSSGSAPDAQLLWRLWQLISLSCRCCLPEDASLLRFVAARLRVEADSRSTFSELAGQAGAALQRYFFSVTSRQQLPSVGELQAALSGQRLSVSIATPEPRYRLLDVDCDTSVHAAIASMLASLGLPERLVGHFGLDQEWRAGRGSAQDVPLQLHHLDPSTLLVDHLSRFDSSLAGYPAALRVRCEFVLRRRILAPLPPDLPAAAQQAAREFVDAQLAGALHAGRLLLWGYADFAVLTRALAAQRQAERGDYFDGSDEDNGAYLGQLARLAALVKSAPAVLHAPASCVRVSRAAYEADFYAQCRQLFGTDRRQALDAVSGALASLPFHAAHHFELHAELDRDHSADAEQRCIVCLDHTAVTLLSPKSKSVRLALPWSAVLAFDVLADERTLSLSVVVAGDSATTLRLRDARGHGAMDDFLHVFFQLWNYVSFDSAYARALDDHRVPHYQMLVFRRGDVIRITKRYLGGAWFEGYVEQPGGSRDVGLFPANLVQPLPAQAAPLHVSASQQHTPLSLAAHAVEPISEPYLPHINTPELRALAVEMFVAVMQYMHDFPCLHDETPLSLAQFLLDRALSSAQLADELVWQICVQVTRHPNVEHAVTGFQLLALCLGLLPPSTSATVDSRVQQTLDDCRDPRLLAYAVYANERWRARRLQTRKHRALRRASPPSDAEFQACLARAPSLTVPVRVCDARAAAHTVHATPLTTVAAAVEQLLAAAPCTPRGSRLSVFFDAALLDDCWAVSLVCPRRQLNHELAADDLLCDALYLVEKRCPSAVLLLRRRLPLSDSDSDALRALVERQIVDDLLSGWLLPPTAADLSTALALATLVVDAPPWTPALFARAQYRDYYRDEAALLADVEAALAGVAAASPLDRRQRLLDLASRFAAVTSSIFALSVKCMPALELAAPVDDAQQQRRATAVASSRSSKLRATAVQLQPLDAEKKPASRDIVARPQPPDATRPLASAAQKTKALVGGPPGRRPPASRRSNPSSNQSSNQSSSQSSSQSSNQSSSQSSSQSTCEEMTAVQSKKRTHRRTRSDQLDSAVVSTSDKRKTSRLSVRLASGMMLGKRDKGK